MKTFASPDFYCFRIKFIGDDAHFDVRNRISCKYSERECDEAIERRRTKWRNTKHYLCEMYLHSMQCIYHSLSSNRLHFLCLSVYRFDWDNSNSNRLHSNCLPNLFRYSIEQFNRAFRVRHPWTHVIDFSTPHCCCCVAPYSGHQRKHFWFLFICKYKNV